MRNRRETCFLFFVRNARLPETGITGERDRAPSDWLVASSSPGPSVRVGGRRPSSGALEGFRIVRCELGHARLRNICIFVCFLVTLAIPSHASPRHHPAAPPAQAVVRVPMESSE